MYSLAAKLGDSWLAKGQIRARWSTTNPAVSCSLEPGLPWALKVSRVMPRDAKTG